MKNLTAYELCVQRNDGTRVRLPSAGVVPTIVRNIGQNQLVSNGVVVCEEEIISVDFKGLQLDPQDKPYVVDREVFDALPASATDFITPDLTTAIRNSYKTVQAITRFLAKPLSQQKQLSLCS